MTDTTPFSSGDFTSSPSLEGGISGDLLHTGNSLKFNFSYAPDIDQAVIDGFEKAASLWSGVITNSFLDLNSYSNKDTEINIFINYGQLSTDEVLGGARPGMVRVNYKDYLTGTFRDISSEADWQAFRSLQLIEDDHGVTEDILAEFGVNQYNTDAQNRKLLADLGFQLNPNIALAQQGKAILDQITLDHLRQIDRKNVDFKSDKFAMLATNNDLVAYDHLEEDLSKNKDKLLDDNGNDNNKKIWLTRANAKAIGLLKGDDDAFDAEIAINSVILGESSPEAIWDFSRVYNDAAGVDATKYDFLSVAQHEIGHALGFVSGLDAFELLSATAAEGLGIYIEDKNLAYVSPMDLYRYSDESRALGTFDWSVSTGDRFFSIDGGETYVASFATGISAAGDGYQSSHWKQQDNFLGVMTPALKRGQALSITDLDVLFLDVMGWEMVGNALLDDMSGINTGISTVGDQLSAKVQSIGLDWKSLETLLTKPAQTFLADLAPERNAIFLHRQTELNNQLTETKTELSAQQDALELLQKAKQAEISTAEDIAEEQFELIEDSQKLLEELVKDKLEFEKDIQELQSKINELQIKFNNATKESDRLKFQSEINKLTGQIAEIDVELAANLEDQIPLQADLQAKQDVFNDLQANVYHLQQELVGLQTTPEIEALELTKDTLEDTLKTLNSLEGQALKLAQKADNIYIKEKLDKIKYSLNLKLETLKELGDGPARLNEEQKALEKVLKLAQEQEKFWNQLVQDHETALFPGADSQVVDWLAGSVGVLKAHMETATLFQLGVLYETVANASGEIQAQWFDKLAQASLLLSDTTELDAKEMAKVQAKIAKKLEKLLEDSSPDGPLSRTRTTSSSTSSWRYWLNRSRSSSSTTTTIRYWQSILNNYMEASAYHEDGEFVEGVEKATLNQMLFSKAAPIESLTSVSPANSLIPGAVFETVTEATQTLANSATDSAGIVGELTQYFQGLQAQGDFNWSVFTDDSLTAFRPSSSPRAEVSESDGLSQGETQPSYNLGLDTMITQLLGNLEISEGSPVNLDLLSWEAIVQNLVEALSEVDHGIAA